MPLSLILIAYLVFINLLAFILYGIDKRRAINRKSRIPESILIWMARLGGGLGCWMAMIILHHKKRHSKFLINVPLWIIVWTFAIVLFIMVGNGNLTEEIDILRSKFRRF